MLNCSRLPTPKTGLCMEPNITDDTTHVTSKVDLSRSDWLSPSLENDFWKEGAAGGTKGANIPTFQKSCPEKYAAIGELNKHSTCTPKCNQDVFFTQQDKHFAQIWISVCAILCFVSTFFTVLTFSIDMARFKYPERPIIFLSFCYNIYSGAYLIRLFVGAGPISCDKVDDRVSIVILEGLDSTGCISVFLILYYFGMASCIWWVILTLTWFLSAGKKWVPESVQALSTYFHFAAWVIPAILTIVILTLRQVDGHELTGLCYVGNADNSALLGFVIIPLCVFFVFGTLFIVLGFSALVKIRKQMKNDVNNREKLEKLMKRIGVFSVLYTVPAVCVLSCFAYEYSNKDIWKAQAFTKASQCKSNQPCDLDNSIIPPELEMFKITMSLAVGFTSGMWIWTSKTWHSWQKFINYRFGRNNRRKCQYSQYHVAPVAMNSVKHSGSSSRHHSSSRSSRNNQTQNSSLPSSHLLLDTKFIDGPSLSSRV